VHEYWTNKHIDHNSLVVTRHLFSPFRSDFQKVGFLNLAVSDSAVLHTFLAAVANILGTMAGRDSRLDMHYHLGQAITIVNKRISNCDYKAISKETVMAIAWLTNMGVCTNSPAGFLKGKLIMLFIRDGRWI
jgi:hypothetical protein